MRRQQLLLLLLLMLLMLLQPSQQQQQQQQVSMVLLVAGRVMQGMVGRVMSRLQQLLLMVCSWCLGMRRTQRAHQLLLQTSRSSRLEMQPWMQLLETALLKQPLLHQVGGQLNIAGMLHVRQLLTWALWEVA
jgi:hypothetical protein